MAGKYVEVLGLDDIIISSHSHHVYLAGVPHYVLGGLIMKAMMSDRSWRTNWADDKPRSIFAHAAHSIEAINEVVRMLALTEPVGVPYGIDPNTLGRTIQNYPSEYRMEASILADALDSATRDGGMLDQLAASGASA